jgi:hypothetical protein
MNSARNGKICRLQCEIFGWDKTRFKILRNDKFCNVSRPTSICVIENAGMVVSWLRRIVDRHSSRRSWFRIGSVSGGFLLNKVALGQDLLLVCWFSPVSIIPHTAPNFLFFHSSPILYNLSNWQRRWLTRLRIRGCYIISIRPSCITIFLFKWHLKARDQ